jgi:hypothetical protein
MSGVTNGAPFSQCLVFENMNAALGRMTTKATLVFGKFRGAAAEVNGPFVRGMAFPATHFSLGHRMVAGKIELTLHISVALKANRLGCARRRNRDTPAKTSGLGASG